MLLYSQLSHTETSHDEEEESVREASSTKKKVPSRAELQRRKDATSPMPASCTSAKIRVSRVTHSTYERLENDTTSSIPKHPSLRAFQGTLEDATFEDGRDSDSNIGPFFDAVEGEEQQDRTHDDAQLQSHATSNSSISDNLLPTVASEELTKMKVKDLKVLSVERELKASGNKKDLIMRLIDSMDSQLWTHFQFQKYLALALIDLGSWGLENENWRRQLNEKGRSAACSNECHPTEKEATVVKANRINDETLDAVSGKLRNMLCYGGPHDLCHVPVKCLQKEPLFTLHRCSFYRIDHRRKNRAQCM